MIDGFALVILCFFVSGCVGGPATRVGYLTTDDQRLVLEQVDGHRYQLVGPQLVDELRTVPGARVEVAGLGNGPRYRVGGYRILDIGNGEQPYVGFVVVDQAGTRIRDEALGRDFFLDGIPTASVRDLHGAKIWITGLLVGADLLHVREFGIIRPPTE